MVVQFTGARQDVKVADSLSFEHMIGSDHLLALHTAKVLYSPSAVALPLGGKERQKLCLPIFSFFVSSFTRTYIESGFTFLFRIARVIL